VADAGARLAAHLERSLAILAAEGPAQLAAMRARLGGRAVLIHIEGAPPVRLCLAGAAPWVTRLDRGDVRVACAQAGVDRFVRGQLTLEEAIERDALRVRGPIDDVLAAFEALSAWLHGALRAPSFAGLRSSYLAGGEAVHVHVRDPGGPT
jgi:hypothetical protein